MKKFIHRLVSLTICLFLTLSIARSLNAQTVVIDSFPLAFAGNGSYVWGDGACTLDLGSQTFNYTVPFGGCYTSITVEMGIASDGNLDWSGGSSGADHLDINITADGTTIHVANQNPDYCNTGNYNTAVTIGGESSCSCDWGQLTPHCSGGYPDCPGGVNPGSHIVQQNFGSVTNLAIKFDYRVTNSAAGGCEDACDEIIQANYIVIKGIECIAPLPVNLVNFDARKRNGKAYLNWNAFETNFKHYVVESSVNGLNWDIAEIIPGKGNSGMSDYHTLLPIPNSEKVYYRLKMIDLDGSFEYSDVRSISGNVYNGYFSVAPNPLTTKMYVNNTLTDGGIYEVVVYSQASKEVLRVKLSGDFEQVDMSDLASGIYIVRISNEEGYHDTHKIVKLD